MPAIDDLAAVQRLLDVPGPRDEVAAAGRARLDKLARYEATMGARTRLLRRAHGRRRGRIGIRTALACGIVAAAAVATTAVLIRPGITPYPGGSPSGAAPAGSNPARAGLEQAILTAINSVGGDIMYVRVTSSDSGSADGTWQYWLWPAKPTSGQRVHVLEAGHGVRVEETYTDTADGAGSLPSHATVLVINPATRSWSQTRNYPLQPVPEQISLHLLDTNVLLNELLRHATVVTGHTLLDGQPAIEFSELAASGVMRVLLWVDAQTYLPLRQVKLHWLSAPDSTQRYDFAFLPPTPANLAKLTPAIPPGYKKTSG